MKICERCTSYKYCTLTYNDGFCDKFVDGRYTNSTHQGGGNAMSDYIQGLICGMIGGIIGCNLAFYVIGVF